MKSNTAIRAENLGKMYNIGQARGPYRTLRESIANSFAQGVQRLRAGKATNKGGQSIWALRDVSFDIGHGEVVGIIGRNGAGKSTLLKIISRITEMTTGNLAIHGRVGSLLEVGTGFHGELTGRENVYLNGAILGMRRAEINRKFDEIVSFAEVEKFIDTPVKRYSSGMYVRLAFAVAAHLESEILLVDEVLAVGDAAFQQKSLGAMQAMGGIGRTVLFVSHNMAAIEHLCRHVIWLDDGQVRQEGLAREIIPQYLTAHLSDASVIDLENYRDRSGNGNVRIVRVELLNGDAQPSSTVRMGGRLTIRMTVRPNGYSGRMVLGAYLHTVDGLLVSDFRTNHAGFEPGVITDETGYDLTIDNLYLYPRAYLISPWVMDPYVREDFDWVKYAVKFVVEPSDFLGTGARFSGQYGISHIPASWRRSDQ